MLELLLNLLLLLGLARRTKTSYGQYWRNETSCGPTEMKPLHGRMRVGHRKGEGELGSGRVGRQVEAHGVGWSMVPAWRKLTHYEGNTHSCHNYSLSISYMSGTGLDTARAVLFQWSGADIGEQRQTV